MFNIINRKTLLAYSKKYPNAKNALFEWYYEFLASEYKNFQEPKMAHPNASLVGNDRVVINILSNHYRLVIRIVFTYKTIQIKWFGPHNDYDKIDVARINFKG